MAASPPLVWRIKAHCKMPPDWWAALALKCIVIAPSSPISIPSSVCTFRRLAATTRHLCKWPNNNNNSGANRSRPQAADRVRGSNLWHLHLDLHPHRRCHEVECRRQTIDLGGATTADVVAVVAVSCCCRASLAIDNCSTNCSSWFGFTNSTLRGSRHPVASWLRFVINLLWFHAFFLLSSSFSLSFSGANPSLAIGRPIRAQPCSSKSL